MSNYHTNALVGADIFTIMGSIYAEVSRYDYAIDSGQPDQAQQAVNRAGEIVEFAQILKQINAAQKLELNAFFKFFQSRVKDYKKSQLDDYLLPFAVSARLRQLK